MHVDGNAVIGALSLALGVDVSEADLVCASCGSRHEVAETRVYRRAPGMVIRCPACGAAEIILVEIAHRFEVTLRGISRIELSRASA